MPSTEENPNILSGQLAIAVGVAIRQHDIEALRDIMRVSGLSLDEADQNWLARTIQIDLKPEDREWLDANKAAIMGDE